MLVGNTISLYDNLWWLCNLNGKRGKHLEGVCSFIEYAKFMCILHIIVALKSTISVIPNGGSSIF